MVRLTVENQRINSRLPGNQMNPAPQNLNPEFHWPLQVYAAGECWLRDLASRATPPPVLYHFTDAVGLAGILGNRILWASLISALNDCSELQYGLHLAADLLEGWKKKHSGAFLEEALACLHVPVSPPQSNTIASNAEAQPFVVSLCGHIDKGVHWLHYGLAGKGVALGFASDSIVVPPFRLLRVEYTRQKQEKQIAGLFKRIQSFVGDKPNSRGRDKVGALIFATLMRILAAGLKDKSFSEEEEWRLVTTSISRIEEPIPAGEGCPPPKYRVVAGRLVPYVEIGLTPGQMQGVSTLVLGYSSPLQASDYGLQMLMRNACPNAKISKSEVPVR